MEKKDIMKTQYIKITKINLILRVWSGIEKFFQNQLQKISILVCLLKKVRLEH